MKETVYDLQTFKRLIEQDYRGLCFLNDVRFCYHIKNHEDGTRTLTPVLSVPVRATHVLSGKLMEHVLYCQLKPLHYLPGVEKEKVEKFEKQVVAEIKKTLGLEPVRGRWEP